jgi:hypothetical protein
VRSSKLPAQTGQGSRQIYELLMPDNTVLTFDVVGIME